MKKVLSLIVLCTTFAFSASADQKLRDLVGIVDFKGRYLSGHAWDQAFVHPELVDVSYEVAEQKPSVETVVTEKRKISPREFHAIKISEESTAILVFDKFGDWVLVELKDDLTWVRLQPFDEYTEYIDVFDGSQFTFLFSEVIQVADFPGGPTREVILRKSTDNGKRHPLQNFEVEVSVIGTAKLTNLQNDDETSAQTRLTEEWLHIVIPELPSCMDEIDDDVV